MNKYKLKKTVNYEGVEITELDLNFDVLTGKDIASAETQYRAAGHDDTVFVKEMNKTYLAYVVAIAAKVMPDMVFELSARDFVAVTNKARNFLLLGA